jgi:hypothetical protein
MSNKGKKDQEIEEVMHESDSDSGNAMELGYLTTAILDYYETTGKESFDEGEDWKVGTEHDKRREAVKIPADLDKEIKKAFIAQVKKFQK